MARFQSTHPRGVRLTSDIITLQPLLFQSTHPRGVRHLYRLVPRGERVFQSTHPRGVRLPIQRTPRAGRYFNPRTHVGCDSLQPVGAEWTKISIHAPTWGATDSYFQANYTLQLFQSTHPRGVRRFAVWTIFPAANFNPRTHVGCDDDSLRSLRSFIHFNPRTHVGCDTSSTPIGQSITISIHAPTWGATELRKSKGTRYKFQSTHPRGVRQGSCNIP